MNCAYHNELEASFTCVECGSNICKECAVNDNGRIICLQCANKKSVPIIKNTSKSSTQYNNTEKDVNYNYNNNNQKRHSAFWATIFSFIPGAGHMYLGIMDRGLQLMLAFFGIIIITNLFYSAEFLSILTVIVWFYSFFDCFHIRKKIERGEDVVGEHIFNFDFKKVNTNQVGIGFVALGGIVLLNEIFSQLLYASNRIQISTEVLRTLRNLTFPVVLIVIGFIILNKAKKNISK